MFFLRKKNIKTIDEINNELRKLSLPTSLSITPINLEQEKKKFFDDPTYNPHFQYKRYRNNNDKILSGLNGVKEISDVDPRISDFYIRVISDKCFANDMINSIGENEKFTEICTKRFGFPSDRLFRNASLISRTNKLKYSFAKKDSSTKKLSSFEIKKIIRTYLDFFGLNNWEIVDSKNITRNRFRVGAKSKEIYVDKDIERTKFSLKRALIHEIGTHAIRSVNGENTGVDILERANIAEYLEAEEGLVLYNQEKNNLLTYKNLKNTALYVIAVYLGVNMSFSDLYHMLLPLTTPTSAFNVAYRVKRGLSDTSIPGIYSRDVVYYKGFKKVRKAIEEDISVYRKLYYGKISLDMIDWATDGLLKEPKIVPNKEMFEKAFIKCGL